MPRLKKGLVDGKLVFGGATALFVLFATTAWAVIVTSDFWPYSNGLNR